MRRILAITALGGSVLALAAGVAITALGVFWYASGVVGDYGPSGLRTGVGGFVALVGLVLAGLGGFEFALVADARAAGARSALPPSLRIAASLAGIVVALGVWSSVGGPLGVGLVVALLLVVPPVAGVIVSVHAGRAVIALVVLAIGTLAAGSAIAARVESEGVEPVRAEAMRTFASRLDNVASMATGPDWTIVSAGVVSTADATLVDETWGIARAQPLENAPPAVIRAVTAGPVRMVVVLQCRGSAEPVSMQFALSHARNAASGDVESAGEPAAPCDGEAHLQRLVEDVTVPDPSVDRVDLQFYAFADYRYVMLVAPAGTPDPSPELIEAIDRALGGRLP